MRYILLIFLTISTINANSVINLSNKNFYKVINSSKPTLVKFYAINCYACKLMEPYFIKASKYYSNKITFAELNIDKYPNLRDKYEIMATPTTIIFRNGKEVDRVIGGMKYDYLEAWVKNIIKYFRL